MICHNSHRIKPNKRKNSNQRRLIIHKSSSSPNKPSLCLGFKGLSQLTHWAVKNGDHTKGSAETENETENVTDCKILFKNIKLNSYHISNNHLKITN